MTIAPIVRSVEVKAPPARAFQAFAGHIGAWWPKGMTISKAPHASITLEPRVGGRGYATDGAGNETPWGKVLVWEPPGRLVLSWEINAKWAPDPSVATEVEVTFAPSGSGTLVTLEHRNLERLGVDAEAYAGQVGGGWPRFLGLMASYAETHR
jgi:uncharacterized protein YndB with AHSA1/START domain